MNISIVVDTGNSSTKGVLVLDGMGEKRKEIRFSLPNSYVEVEEGFHMPPEDISNPNNYDFSVNVELGEGVVSGRYIAGDYQELEYSGFGVRPSGLYKKYNAPTTVLALAMVYMKVAQLLENMGVVVTGENGLHISTYALVPAGDTERAKVEYPKLIKAIKSIERNTMNGWETLTVEHQDIVILPEGYCGYLGVVMERTGVRSGYEVVRQGKTLVLDIGAGTTECVIAQNGRLLNEARTTLQVGGNNVVQRVQNLLRVDGLDLDLGTVQAGIVSGSVPDGAGTLDIRDYINQAKNQVASSLTSSLVGYLEASGHSARTINNVLFLGGGVIAPVEGVIDMKKALENELRRSAPNIGVVELPLESRQVIKDNNLEIVKSKVNERDLNIIGATYFVR